jgi:CRISPR-associated endonuclease/helicase Cas3
MEKEPAIASPWLNEEYTSMPPRPFADFFKAATGSPPHGWQATLADLPLSDRLIRIPTGFGKTAGTILAWAYHRCLRGDLTWPTRLAFCLPMRVLVEQTADSAQQFLDNAGIRDKVSVHVLMGGAECEAWYRYPESPAILVGTQDMLLSRALNRGYASARARWPMEFGLLNQDCLWIMDEVQLMDVGLATSGQLQAFRRESAGRGLRPTATWWMSATLQRDWLLKSPETKSLFASLAPLSIPKPERHGPLWDGVRKELELHSEKADEKSVASLVAAEHLAAGKGEKGPTLVVVNRVDRAVAVFEALQRLARKRLNGTDLRLVHSRFRPRERARWRQSFLSRDTSGPGTDRIIIATQVVEAGVDVSAGLLVTDIAPWPSLVQRFGRAARWGGSARVVVLDTKPKDDKAAAPYSLAEIDAAREALKRCDGVGPLELESFEETHPDLLAHLYPYEPQFLLLREEVDDLFDTSPDLSGDDVDISRFVRSGEERDLQVAWFPIAERAKPAEDLRPPRDALCAVPVYRAREWLAGRSRRFWVWDWVEGEWRRGVDRDLFPGQTIIVEASAGGYSMTIGWSASSSSPVASADAPVSNATSSESAIDDDALSAAEAFKTICTHSAEAAESVLAICDHLQVPSVTRRIFEIAAHNHDAGKTHPAFRSNIVVEGRLAGRKDLAKAPSSAWKKGRDRHQMPDGSRRRGLRHELASTLSLFSVLQRHAPGHPALLGPIREVLEAAGMLPVESHPTPTTIPSAAEATLIALDGPSFDLAAYLICSHHGKIRVSWHTSPLDQASNAAQIAGICDGDELPELLLPTPTGNSVLPPSKLSLSAAAVGLNPATGRGWTDRVLELLDRHGPFALAWMEAVLRAADQRASAQCTPDPLLIAEEGR